jgi:hypothetical protein
MVRMRSLWLCIAFALAKSICVFRVVCGINDVNKLGFSRIMDSWNAPCVLRNAFLCTDITYTDFVSKHLISHRNKFCSSVT